MGGCLDLVLAVALRVVEGGVGRPNHLQRVGSRDIAGDAEACRHPHRRVSARNLECGERRADPLGRLDRPRKRGSRQDDQELFAAPATADVDVSEGLLEHARELLENEVAEGVSVRVVGGLELVDVAEDDRERQLVTLAPGDLGAKPLLAMAPVCEAGEPIGGRVQRGRFVQSRVLERVRSLSDQRPGGDQIVLAELGGVEDQDPTSTTAPCSPSSTAPSASAASTAAEAIKESS